MIRLIACDLDGTLIPPGQFTFDPEIFGIIEKLSDRGIRFMAASGRQHGSLRRLFAPVCDRIDYLCENGCLVFLDGKKVMKETMEDGLAHSIIHDILGKPGAEALVSGEETSYVCPKSDWFLPHMLNNVKNDCTVTDDLDHIPEAYFKVSVMEDEKSQISGRQYEYWERLYGDQATVVTGGNGWLDFMPKGVNKGTAIQWTMDYLNLKKEEVMAFGDNYNDEEMLNSVEYSYAMTRAPQEIKDFAYGTCSSVIAVLKDFLSRT